MKILVLWADRSAANFGLHVLAEGTAKLVRDIEPTAEVDFQDFGKGESDTSFGLRSIVRDIGRKRGPIKEKISRYDVILDTGGGDSFADIYGMKRLFMILYAQLISRRLGKTVILGPQTIGPFNTTLGRALAIRSLKAATAVFARDEVSAVYSRDVLRRSVTAVGTDVVFSLSPERLRPRWDVAINISGLLWYGNAHVGASYYRRQVQDLVSQLVARGRCIVLVPHVIGSIHGRDDLDAIDEFLSQSGLSVDRVAPSSLAEVRSVLASADVVVGARMHACLNALSQGVPAVPWAYSRKFVPLFSALGWNYGYDLRDGGEIGLATAQDLLGDGRIEAMRQEARDCLLRVAPLTERVRAAMEVALKGEWGGHRV